MMPFAKIRVAAQLNSVPYVEYSSKISSWSGIFVSSLSLVCQRLKYRCEYFVPPYNYNLGNETIDGVLGAVTNRTADVGLAPVGITFSRSSHFNFIYSFLRATYVVVIHKDNLISYEQSDFITRAIHSLYTNGCWLTLCVVTFIFIVLGTFSDWNRTKLRTRGSSNDSLARLSSNWTFYLLGSAVGASDIGDFENQPQRVVLWSRSKFILITTWIIYTFIILVTLTSRLPMIFTFDDQYSLPFVNIEALLNSDFIVYGTDTAIEMLNVSETNFHLELAQKMHILPYTPKGVEPEPVYVELLKKGKTAMVLRDKTLVKMSNLNCDLIVAIGDLGTLAIAALVLPKNSSFQNSFEYGYALMNAHGISQKGVIQFEHFIRNATRPRPHSSHSCYGQKISSKRMVRRHVMHLENLNFLFKHFFIALTICTAFLVCETVVCFLSPANNTKKYISPSRRAHPVNWKILSFLKSRKYAIN